MASASAWNGLLIVNKEAGFTSNDVVAKLRGILKQRRIGHTGTLDPEAVGVLVCCLGSATKVVSLLTAHSKEYIAAVQLGVTTDTQDMTGEVLARREYTDITREKLAETLRAFKGTYEQIPPMYSAVRVNGQRLYRLAREGKTIERSPRPVTIEAISLLDDSLLTTRGLFTMEVRCSKGTYIRTLCHDIGGRLLCGAAMAQLTRTAVGSFRLEEARTLSQIAEMRDAGTLAEAILPVEGLFRDMDRVTVAESFRRQLENGNSFGHAQIAADLPADEDDAVDEEARYEDGALVRVYCGGAWFGIYRYSKALRQFRVEKFFYEPELRETQRAQ